MGNSTTKGPSTEKIVFDNQTKDLRFGVCEMQGWRREMEDASIAVGIFDATSSLFGVLDGHGGSLVSRFVATNFLNILISMKSYKQTNYEQALIETYLKFDELLRLDKINHFLLDSHFQICGKLGNNLSEKREEYSASHIIDFSKGEKSPTRDFLSLNDQKVEINLKNFQENIISESNEDLIAKDMGTTANILLIKNNYLYLANVGDSLSVAFKNGQAILLNQEHKTTLPSEFARIGKSGAKIVNNRVEGRLNLTRAIGDLNFKNNLNLKFYEQAVTAYPEITKMKITNDIEFIIMACDGVWDCVDPQKLCEHLSSRLKTEQPISKVLGELFDQILSKTNNIPVGTDNMTCIVIQFLNNK